MRNLFAAEGGHGVDFGGLAGGDGDAEDVGGLRVEYRRVHNAHRIEMRGESMRKKRSPPDENQE